MYRGGVKNKLKGVIMESRTNNSSQTNPNISIQTGHSQQIEPLIVGNANTITRVLIFGFFLMLVTAGWLVWRIATLQEKITFLEDVVINKVYTISKGE